MPGHINSFSSYLKLALYASHRWVRYVWDRTSDMRTTLQFAWTLAILFIAMNCSPVAAAAQDALVPNPEAALNRLYNFDFKGAHHELNQWTTAHPADPLGPAFQAATYMFTEFARLQILEGEFFEDDKAIASKKKLKADPEIKAAFDKNVDTAQKLAQAALAKNPNDQNALFAYSVATGVQMDYASLVEKRGLTSLSYAKQAQEYTHQLLQLNPKFVDAYLTKGFSQYLLSSLPFFVRWFVHFDGVEPDKQAAIQNLLTVAHRGHYLKAYAKILLAIIYLREKQPDRAAQLLTQLSKEYPENPLLRKELSKIEEAMARGDFGRPGTT